MYNGGDADRGWASIPGDGKFTKQRCFNDPRHVPERTKAVDGWKDVYVGNVAWWSQSGRSLNELIEKEALMASKFQKPPEWHTGGRQFNK